jgi:hypothetical protein
MSRGARRRLSFEASEPARKAAAAVLSVLAGIKTSSEACEALGVSANRYLQLEARALLAMVKGLEPLPRGRRRAPEAEMERLRREKTRWEREASRYQALWRASQRALGLAPAASKSADLKGVSASGKRARRPRVRAKAVIAALSASMAPQETAMAATGGTA